jgi:hypothetical protein
MANNHITYDRNTPIGQLTAEMIDHIAKARASAQRIHALLLQMGALAGPLAGAVLEGGTLFGVAAGQGDAFVTALEYVNDGLRGAVPLAQDQVANLDLGG